MDNSEIIERAFTILRKEQITSSDAQKIGETFSFIATQLQTVTEQLNHLYDILHDSSVYEMNKIIGEMSNDQVSIRQAIETYDKEWFEALPWPPIVKVELANNLNNMCIAVLGSPSDLWSSIASSLQGA